MEASRRASCSAQDTKDETKLDTPATWWKLDAAPSGGTVAEVLATASPECFGAWRMLGGEVRAPDCGTGGGITRLPPARPIDVAGRNASRRLPYGGEPGAPKAPVT